MIFLKTLIRLSYFLQISLFFGLNGNPNHRGEYVLGYPLSKGSEVDVHVERDIDDTGKYPTDLSHDKHLNCLKKSKPLNRAVENEEKQALSEDVVDERSNIGEDDIDDKTRVLAKTKLNHSLKGLKGTNLDCRQFSALNEFIEKTNSLVELIKAINRDIKQQDAKFKRISRRHIKEDIAKLDSDIDDIVKEFEKKTTPCSSSSTICPVRKAYCSGGYEDAGAWTPPQLNKDSVNTAPTFYFKSTTNGKCQICHFVYRDELCSTRLMTSTSATTNDYDEAREQKTDFTYPVAI